MKKLILLFSIMVWCGIAEAQAPQLINYQAVIRDANNEVIENKSVSIQLTILKTHSVGIQVYQEEHRVTTNSFGLVNLQIGAGSNKVGSLSDVDWGTDVHVLKVSIDQSGGSAFQVMGYAQLVSVPYALYAANVSYSDTSATNELQLLSFSNDTLRLSNGNSVYLPSKDYSKDISDLNDSIVVINSRLITIQQQVRNDSIYLAGLINNHVNADQDVDSLNEIQNLSITGNTLTISKGNSVILPGGAAQSNDNDSTNELISVVSFVGSTLSITDAGGTKSANLSALLDNTDAQTLSLSGNVLSIGGGNSVTLPGSSANNDNDSTNELNSQVQFSGNVLTITDAGGSKSANLSSLLDNTDSQTLSLSGNTLSISGGNSVTLPASGAPNNDNDSTNEIQSLSRSSDTLFISKSNYVVLPTGSVNTDDQNLSLSGDTLYIENGSPVILTKYLNTDAQNLTLSGNTLSISGGNSVTLPAGGAPNNDNDSTNELQTLNLTGNTLSISNGNSVTLASGAVNHDNDSTNELITSVLLSNDTLSITDAGGTKSVSLSNYLDNTDTQMLSLSGDTIYLSNGGFVKLPAATSGFDGDSSITNELQNLTINSDTLSISNGNFVVLPSGTVNTDDQNLTISGDTLSIEDGNFVILPSTKVNNDNDSTNELNSSLALSGTTLTITDAGGAKSANLSTINTDNQTLSLSGNTLSISGGNNVTLPANSVNNDNDSTNEIQTLTLTGNTLSISNGNSVTLASGAVNNDNDSTNELNTSVSVSGNTLSITDAGGSKTADLSAFKDNTDSQTLSVNGSTLSISGGNSVTLPAGSVNNDNDSTNELNTAFTLSSNNLTITDAAGAKTVNLAGYLDNTDAQTLSLSGNTLSISGGNNVTFPSGNAYTTKGIDSVLTAGNNAAGLNMTNLGALDVNNGITASTIRLTTGAGANKILTSDASGNASWQTAASISLGDTTQIADLDGDTKIMTEESSDEDIIRFDLAGTERWIMQSTRIEPTGTGGSVFIGLNAGQNDDLTNNNNTFLGNNSGQTTTTGYYNVGVGRQAMLLNSTGRENTSVGGQALYSNTSGWRNASIGYQSMYSNQTGIANTAMGSRALRSNSNTSYNSAFGYDALYSNSSTGNTALGSFAGRSLVTGAYNAVVGYAALYSNVTGARNVAIGNDAMRTSVSGSNNTVVGQRALYRNINGNNNVVLGRNAGFNNSTGSGNVLIGYQAGYSETGSDKLYIDNSNTASPLIYGDFSTDEIKVNGDLEVRDDLVIPTGAGAGKLLTSDANGKASWTVPGAVSLGDTTQVSDLDGDTKIQMEESTDEDIMRFDIAGTEQWVMKGARLESYNSGRSVFIGEQVGQNDDLSNNDNVFVGYRSGRDNTTGSQNTAIGGNALRNNTTGRYNSATGYSALWVNTIGQQNSAYGYYALGANTSGSYNSAFGLGALRLNNTGRYNTATGYYALYRNATGEYNAAVGASALRFNTTGFRNAALGYASLYFNTTGFRNVGTGMYTLYRNTTGYDNVASGYYSSGFTTTGYENAAIGVNSLYQNTTGSRNAALGFRAGYYGQTGVQNTYVGSYAGSASGTNFSNVTALGYNARTTASNQVRIGNSSVTSIGGQVGWTTISDGRFKENVKSDVAGIDFIMKLEPVTYTLKTEEIFEQLENTDSLETYGSNTTDRLEKSKTVQSGFIAQDVEKAAKELGYSFSGVDAPKNDQDIYGLRYSEFVVPLVKAMQEQQEMINKQQELIEQLEERIKSLER